jgi:hypothetical protein
MSTEEQNPPQNSGFVRLVDFISSEEKKKEVGPDSKSVSKMTRLRVYQEAQEKKFDESRQQKGIQINKAA